MLKTAVLVFQPGPSGLVDANETEPLSEMELKNAKGNYEILPQSASNMTSEDDNDLTSQLEWTDLIKRRKTAISDGISSNFVIETQQSADQDSNNVFVQSNLSPLIKLDNDEPIVSPAALSDRNGVTAEEIVPLVVNECVSLVPIESLPIVNSDAFLHPIFHYIFFEII